ncbi:hypothetical protein M0R45_000040 [Rubus argutus]|uniref:Uncharacterized protein n=1 Tax=Rubus argutus TaxID=59490 RepID=A0AAW1VPG5_RUBAR
MASSSSDPRSDSLEVGDVDDFKVHVFKSSSELLEKLHEKWSQVTKKPYPAMYSSTYGGIILDPALMVIPIDDHMVHRGHGVFDTAIILNGYLYELDVHLNRFLRSASKARITSPFDRSTLRSILGVPTSAFYAVVIDEDFDQCKEGVKVITSTIPMKSSEMATMKNVNYLPNVLAKLEAEDKGAFASIWVDEKGYIAEGPNVNVAFVTHEKELVVPFFDKILSGCTVLRLLELAPKLVEQGRLKCVRTGNLTVEEAKGSAEMMFVGSTLPLLPIIAWDEQPIGDGKVGELTMALSDLVWDDMVAGPTETQRTLVPYI